MKRLEGKIALVTGAAGGIGAAAARHMALEGACVAIADISADAGQAIAQDIIQRGGRAFFVRLDVTREEDWTDTMAAIIDRFGGLDILVNNAGLYLGKSFEDASFADWQRICSVNLTGLVLGTRSALHALRERGRITAQGSAIINMSSVAGLKGSAVDPLYSMTKGGVTTFTKATAIEFGRKGYRIRVNSVHPDAVQTEMSTRHYVEKAGTHDPAAIEQLRQAVAKALPIQRVATPGDIAAAVVFLASDEAGFMTGSSLVIDGGATA